jgi:hypothetical protein
MTGIHISGRSLHGSVSVERTGDIVKIDTCSGTAEVCINALPHLIRDLADHLNATNHISNTKNGGTP